MAIARMSVPFGEQKKSQSVLLLLEEVYLSANLSVSSTFGNRPTWHAFNRFFMSALSLKLILMIILFLVSVCITLYLLLFFFLRLLLLYVHIQYEYLSLVDVCKVFCKWEIFVINFQMWAERRWYFLLSSLEIRIVFILAWGNRFCW